MAIPDLLWACPRCGADRGLRAGRRGARCAGCGTRFHRVDGARIRATSADGSAETRPPTEWVRMLPHMDTLLDRADAAQGEGEGEGLIRRARVRVRFVVAEEPVRGGGHYLNRMERYGPETGDELRLYADRLELQRRTWPFDSLRAVQTSSRSLQLRDDAGVASIRFDDDSSFLWEQLLTAALRRFYRRAGRGDIVEFQPRIVTR